MAWKDNKERPKYVTKKLAHDWQPYVDSLIRRYVHKGMEQLEAVDRALDLRDEHIRKGDKPPRYGRK